MACLEKQIDVRPNHCTKLKSSLSTCEKCVSLCPVNAIRFGDHSIDLSPACIGCGFCITACPNDVFVLSDQKSRAIAAPDYSGPIYCSKLLSDGMETLPPFPQGIIPCIGAITPQFVLGWSSELRRPLKLVTMDCSQCPLKAGAALFEATLAEVSSVLEPLKVPFEPVVLQMGTAQDRLSAQRLYRSFAREREESRNLTRREVFTRFWKRPGPGGKNGDPQARPDKGRPPSQGRPLRRLEAVISLYRENQGNLTGEEKSGYFSRIDIGEQCTGCGLCAAHCPENALVIKKDGLRAFLNWTAARCTQCNLCAEVCPEHALSFSPGLEITEVLHETATPVVSFYRDVCPVCNREHLSREAGSDCPYCREEKQIKEQFSSFIFGTQA